MFVVIIFTNNSFNQIAQKGVQTMGDKKSKKDKAKGNRQKEAKQQKASKQKKDNQLPR